MGYEESAGQSEPYYCNFDKKANAVIAVYCRGNGRLLFERNYLALIGYDSARVIQKNLLSVSVGMTADSVSKILGDYSEICEFPDSVVWRFPREWLGFHQPRIAFARGSMTVMNVDVGADRFVVR